MATFIEGVKSALRFAPCIALGNAEWAYGAAGRIFPFGPAEEGIATVRALRRFIGCNPDNDPEEPQPPFQGGQCDGQLYVGSYTYTQGNNPPITARFKAWGPIGGAVEGTDSNGTPGVGLISRGDLTQNSPAFQCGVGGNPTLGTLTYRQFASNATNPSIQSITPCGADNCGGLPPVLPPPTNININIDVTYNNEEGDEINLTIPFIFAPINVDINGRFNIPVTFNLGGVEFSGTVTIAPEFSVTINPPQAPTGTDNPTDTLPPGDPEDEVEPREFDDKVIGVVVQSSLSGEQQLTTIATANIPTIFAPRAGSIKFAYSIGASTFWSNDIDVKGGRVFIPCPFSQGADAVAVSPAPGVVLNWVEITGPPLATVADLT